MSTSANIRPKPIEEYFPISEVNEIARREKSIAGRHYRPIYTVHKWWARRLGSVFRTILLYSLADKEMKVRKDGQKKLVEMDWNNLQELWNYYIEDVNFNGQIVLDPMMGGGTTLIEALRMGCNVIGGEINPLAWYIVKKEIEPVDLDKLERAFEELEEKIAPEVRKYYKTICPYCGEQADVIYVFWFKKVECLNCGTKGPLFKDYMFASGRSSKENLYHVLCPNCQELFKTKNYRSDNTCPQCGYKFNPGKDGDASARYYTCPKCGQRNEIVEATKRLGKLDEKIYAIEFFCKNCDNKGNNQLFHGKGYKKAENFDLILHEKAAREYEEIKNKLPIPHQKIPEGYNTRQMLNFGYERFQDMFNKRQLLNLGKILKAIMEIKDENTKEYFLLAFSEHLKFNNMFCRYNRSKNQLSDIFRGHEYQPQKLPVESNVWGTEYGTSFPGIFEKLSDGKRFCKYPYEKYVIKGKVKERKSSNMIEAKIVDSFKDLGVKGNAILLCGSSEYIPIPDNTVDAVITDPPYYGNVMYSELSDFFYVWLRIALKDKYDYFQSELTPKSAEVVKNPVQGKGEKDFIDGLTRIFVESGKKLKNEGIMVFTFHHRETRAWASVLRSVLDSGFYITATYPVVAEMPTSTRIMNKANIEYDTIVVCRKRGKEEAERTSWRSLEDNIYFRAKDAIEKLEKEQKRLSQGDIFVITLGKCLEIYSKHYPNVVKNGKKVGVQEAVEYIREIVDDQIMSARLNELAVETDLTSAIYLTYVVGRDEEISFNSLNKELRNRNLDISKLTGAELLEREGSMLKVLKPLKRTEIVKSKRRDNLISVDRAHYLYHLYKEGNLLKEMDKWADIKAIKVLRILGQVENNKEYGKLADFIESKMPQEGLEKWM